MLLGRLPPPISEGERKTLGNCFRLPQAVEEMRAREAELISSLTSERDRALAIAHELRRKVESE